MLEQHEHEGHEEVHDHPGCPNDGLRRWVCSCGACSEPRFACGDELEVDWTAHKRRAVAPFN